MDSTLVFNIQPGLIWDWRVAADLFAGGAGVGAFLFAVVVSGFAAQRYRRLAQTAAIIAPFLVMFGLLLLYWKLGNKLNVYQVVINFAPTSLMWWGFLIQSALVALGLVHAWQWRDLTPNVWRARIGLVGSALAVLVGIYHGLILAVLTSHPLWATGATVFMAVLAFVTTGIAGALLAHVARMVVAGRSEEERDLTGYVTGLRPVRDVVGVALVLTLLNVFLWWIDLSFGSLQSRQALQAASEVYAGTFWVAGIGLGVIVPLALLAWSFGAVPSRKPTTTLSMIGATSLLILIGGFFLRYVVVLGGQVALPITALS